MNRNKNRLPELLAPAGSLAAGLTAFDYGADAVYAGLTKFNARERTENFSLEEMSKLIAYAHKINKKVYVTFNTLVKESELEDAAEQLYHISCLQSDAVIVQDIGILRIIREYFPNLEIHASTQMGIHNSAGVNFAAKLGIKRVILERQVNLAELKQIVKNSVIETEIFIHGALCCSISGSCLLSSWLGGWSGNRGKCKQPCRRRYYSDKGNGFFFSTKDLYSLDTIQDLKQIGLNSLKIEGRLRKPDYVKNVVSAYRMILDANPNEESNVLLNKAKNILSRSLGRKWSGGFRDSESCKDVIQHTLLGVSGQPCGKVTSIKQSGFTIKLTQKLHIGDRVRVQPKSGDEGPTLTITKLSQSSRAVTKGTKGFEYFVHCDKEIPKDGIVYKIGESGGDLTGRIANLPIKANYVNLGVTVKKTGLSVDVKNIAGLPTWEKDLAISDALKSSLAADTVVKEFRASNSKEYRTDNIDVSIHGNLFLPASELKKARREFWEWLLLKISPEQFSRDSIIGLKRFKEAYDNIPKQKDYSLEKTVFLPVNQKNPIENSITIHSLEDFCNTTDEIQLPNYCFEYDLNNTSRKIRAAIKKGHKRFRVTSLYGFELLKGFKDLQISTSFPLPVCNSSATYEIKTISSKLKLKLNHAQIWLELEKDEINSLLKKSPIPMEIYTYGRPHLLVTRAFVSTDNIISDSKGNKFIIIKDRDNKLVYLFSEKVLSIPEFPNTSTFFDLTNAKPDEKNTSTFNYEYSML